jgi:hypothetical protein
MKIKTDMRKLIQLPLILIFIAVFSEGMAQTPTLLYYWHFNSLATSGVNYGRNLLINSDSTTPAITTPGTVTWQLQAGDPNPSVDTINIADNVAGDFINARGSALNTPTANNWGLRPRNPSQYGQLVFNIPTTGFQNIIIKFECESSSTASGILNQLLDYSTDGGNTYSSTGIAVTTAPSTVKASEDSIGIVWGLVVVDLTAATAVNNASSLLFRIRYTGPNAVQSKTSGNDRFDNFTVESGSSSTATIGINAMDAGYNMYPNPSYDGQVYFTAPTTGVKNVVFYNTTGQAVYTTSVSGTSSSVNVGNLVSGIYYININDNNTNYTLKFVKN